MAHFSFASLFQIGLLFVLICWTTESTGAAFSLEEEFKQLKENYIQMKEILKNLESEMSEVKAKNVEMQNKMNELEDKNAQQDSLLFDLLREKNERTAAAANPSPVAINGLPSSCGDLKIIGHIWSGFYSIAGSAMIESVYCDFSKLPSDPDFQKWIGYADVKSAPVHFYVQRNSSFITEYTPIPFDLAVVNEGNALDLTTGKFTAPRPGIYFFSFTGLVDLPASSGAGLGVFLYLNGGQIGVGYVEELNTAGQYSPLTLQSTLNLKKDDQIWVEITAQSTGATYLPFLYDSTDHRTHFTGFMLQEEIVASL